MSTDSPSAQTVVLIHGLWLTPLSWENWIARFEAAGHRVIAPAWPGMEDRSVEDLRSDTSAYATLGVSEIAEHYDSIIRRLDEPPIIIGHSFGGLITQILLDRGLGAAGVAIHPAPIKGVLVLPPSQLKAAWPALKNPANRHRAVLLSPEEFHYGFTNTMGDSESKPIYDRYAIPGPGRVLFQAGLANFNPNAVTKVNLHNDRRPPLLLTSGSEDHTVPASTVKSSYRLQSKGGRPTEYKEYAGRPHLTGGVPGWEQVADDALEWAVSHSRQAAVV
jgi:pimeloyl-ACP methyl ester carboxylesterase